MPTLPPRLELVLLLAAAATGYNLTMQMLPSQRIDLAQLEVEERLRSAQSLGSSPSAPDSTVSVSITPTPATVMNVAVVPAMGTCAIPPTGGPALNERFEPC